MSDVSGEIVLQPGQRWSTWTDTEGSQSRGPEPYPDWLVVSDSAIDTELGLIKPGKEASLYLIERKTIDGSKSCLLGAKRYRPSASGWALYKQGRDLRSQRDKRALKKMSNYGKYLAQSEWAKTEFAYLRLFWVNQLPVPYPVQIHQTEVLLEWIGDQDGQASPQLYDVDLTGDEAERLFLEVSAAIIGLARLGFAHGDLSPYNILVRDGHLVIIDFPQVVDLAKNQMGLSLLERDCANICQHFAKYGVVEDHGELYAQAVSQAWS